MAKPNSRDGIDPADATCGIGTFSDTVTGEAVTGGPDITAVVIRGTWNGVKENPSHVGETMPMELESRFLGYS